LAVALCTAAPTDASTGATITEVANSNGYARQTLNPSDANWTAASATDGLTDNASALNWTASGGNWGVITHFVVADSATHGAGNVLFHGAFAASRTINNGDSLTIPIGALDIQFA